MATIVDGNAIAREIEEELRRCVAQMATPPRLDIFVVGNDTVTAGFVRRKEKMATNIGINFVSHTFEASITTPELISEIYAVAAETDAIVVQLPLPVAVHQEDVLSAIPTEKDVDVLSACSIRAFHTKENMFLPPVAGAAMKILTAHNVDVNSKKCVVVGKGKLVGAPVAELLTRAGGAVTILDSTTPKDDFLTHMQSADIVVSGAGVPELIQPEMLKDGVVLIDAGTSNSTGAVVGDIAQTCSSKASIFSTTPGGIGPVTVGVLLENVVHAAE